LARKGWENAKEIANGNGKHLARLILDYKEICTNDDVRLIAHSLGARVTLAALQSLHTNPDWTNTVSNEIKSVHLVGAAVDNEQISTKASDCSSNKPPFHVQAKP
jgi:esterase/lipase superfamily enzyme